MRCTAPFCFECIEYVRLEYSNLLLEAFHYEVAVIAP